MSSNDSKACSRRRANHHRLRPVFGGRVAQRRVTRRGAEAAVLVPVGEWQRLQAAARPSLKQLLLSDEARVDLLIPARGSARRRKAAAAG
jgi:prevent-host-death family protein